MVNDKWDGYWNDAGEFVRPDGGVVRGGPATYQRPSSAMSVTTRTGSGPLFDAYSALFANARTPRDQAKVRERYASALMEPAQPMGAPQPPSNVLAGMLPAAREEAAAIPGIARGIGPSTYQAGPKMTAGSAGAAPASAEDEKFYTNKLRHLLTNPGAFEKTPGFKAALDTGRQAIERSFAARGMGNSGNVLAELMKYGTGLASQEYGNQLARLRELSRDEQTLPNYWRNTEWGVA